VASLAGRAREFSAAGPLEVVEDKVGTGSVDFWGSSFSPSSTEQGPMEEAELERGITILQACWAYFDAVAARVSPRETAWSHSLPGCASPRKLPSRSCQAQRYSGSRLPRHHSRARYTGVASRSSVE